MIATKRVGGSRSSNVLVNHSLRLVFFLFVAFWHAEALADRENNNHSSSMTDDAESYTLDDLESESIDPDDEGAAEDIDIALSETSDEDQTGESPEEKGSPKALPGGGTGSGGVGSQSLSLPSGGSSMSGMGESFSPNLNMGSGSMSVPLAFPTGRRGLQPTLGLSYSTGGGDGPAGWGWSLGVPFISRQSDKGMARYDRTDRFMYNGGQELIRIALPSDEAWPSPAWNPSSGSEIEYFRARQEGGFLRFFYNRTLDTWLVQDRQGNHYYFGETASSKVETPKGTYQWSISRLADIRRASGAGGNDIHYRYLRDGGMLYIQGIYWNSYSTEYGVVEKYQHALQLFYEDRPDGSESYHSGFKQEQRFRLERIEVSSYGNAPEGSRELVRAYLLSYLPEAESIHSRLSRVQMCGRGWLENADTSDRELCLPPLDFHYSETQGLSADGMTESAFIPGFGRFNENVKSLNVSPDVSAGDANVEFMDVNQDGLTDLFMTNADHFGSDHAAILNDGYGNFDADENLVRVGNPAGWSLNLANMNVSVMDIDGSGGADLLHMPYTSKYHYYRLSKECADDEYCWEQSDEIPVNNAIDFTSDASNIRMVDINNDRLIDIVRSTGTAMEHFVNLSSFPGYAGQFGHISSDGDPVVEEPIRSCVLHRGRPMQFHEGNLQFADMNGDGLSDLVDLTSGSIAYWPNRGYGQWGASDEDCLAGTYGHGLEVEMQATPYFSNLGLEGVMLADVNGDGLADIVQVRFSSIDIWLNRGNNSFSTRHIIEETPYTLSGNYNTVRMADLNGNGTADVVWADAGGYQYLDLVGDYRELEFNGGIPGGLLERTENGLGGTTWIEYTTTTEMMLEAREAGDPWETVIPFPMTVVKRSIAEDHLDEVGGPAGVYFKEYVYRDPFYDAHESEFKGFSYSESWDRDKESGMQSCDAESIKRGEAPIVSRNWYHRGIRPECTAGFKSYWGPDSKACKDALHLDNPLQELTGLSIKSDVWSPCTGGIFTATVSQFEVRRLFENLGTYSWDDRDVYFVIPHQGYAYKYDPSQTLQTDGTVEEYDAYWLIDSKGNRELVSLGSYAPSSPDGTFHRTSGSSVTGDHGYPTEAHFFGFHRYSDAPLYEHADCDQYSQYFSVEFDPATWVHTDAGSYRIGPQSESGGACENHCTAEKPCSWLVKEYNGYGELTRSSLKYWDYVGSADTSMHELETSRKTYNSYGQLLEEGLGCEGIGFEQCKRHTGYKYDSMDDGDLYYSAFMRQEIAYVPDGAVTQFVTRAKWDAGLGQVTQITSADGAESKVEHDALGRMKRSFGPRVDTGKVCDIPKSEYVYHYETAPLVYLETRVNTSRYICGATHDPEGAPKQPGASWDIIYTWIDGLGNPYASVSPGDNELGASASYPWIVGGVAELNKKGGVYTSCEAMPLSQLPLNPRDLIHLQQSIREALGSELATGHWNCSHNEFDEWGRRSVGFSADGTMSKAGFGVDEGFGYDHLDLNDPEHSGTYTSERVDGMGRTVETVTRHREGDTGEVVERRSHAEYDALGLPLVMTKTENGVSISRRNAYDSLGRVRVNQDLNFGRWEYEYDELGEMIRTINPNGDVAEYFYDLAGRTTAEYFNGELEARYYYDEYPGDEELGLDGNAYWTGYPSFAVTLGRLVAHKDRSGTSITAANYGSFSESWRQVHPSERIYHFEGMTNYRNEIEYSKDADGHKMTVDYYESGALRRASFNGQQIIKDTLYNFGGQVELMELGDGGNTTIWHGYDPVMHRAEHTVIQQQTHQGTAQATLIAFSYQYDRLGQLTGIADWRGRGAGALYHSELQNLGYVSDKHPAEHVQTYTGYNQANFPDWFDDTLSGPLVWNADDVNDTKTGWPVGAAPSDAAFDYDTLYQLVGEDREYVTNGGDDDGPLVKEDAKPYGRVKAVDWKFDANGSMVSWTEDSASPSPDNLGRALGSQIVNGYQLNEINGCDMNVLSYSTTIPAECKKPDAIYFAANVNEVGAEQGTCIWLEYDDGGRMTRQVIRTGCSSCSYAGGVDGAVCPGYAGAGTFGQPGYLPPIPGGKVEYDYYWNSRNQLAGATRTDDGTLRVSMAYVYDSKGNRVVREKSDVLSEVTNRRQDIYLGSYERRQVELVDDGYNPLSVSAGLFQLNAELLPQSRGMYQDVDGTKLVKYSSGARIQQNFDASQLVFGQPEIYFVLKNHLGSTSAVIDFSDGSLVEWRTNYAYGSDESHWKNDQEKYDNAEEPYGFTGKEEDSAVGLHYFGARYYSSYLGRWLSPDPVPVHQGVLSNYFGYGGNSPYIYVDPDGRWIHIAIAAVVGAVVGAITGAIKGGWKGALIGAAIGAASGALIAATGGAAAGAFAAATGVAATSTAATAVGAVAGALMSGVLAVAQAKMSGASWGQAFIAGGMAFGASMLTFGAGSALGSCATAVGQVVQNVAVSAAVSALTTVANVAIQTGGDLSKADWDTIIADWAIGVGASAVGSTLSAGLNSMAKNAAIRDAAKAKMAAGKSGGDDDYSSEYMSNEEAAIAEEARLKAVEELNRAIAELDEALDPSMGGTESVEETNARLEKYFGDSSDFTKRLVRANLVSIRDHIEAFDVSGFERGSQADTYAWVWSDEPERMVLSDSFYTKSGETGKDSRFGVIIHEASHYEKTVGTTDHIYGDQGCQEMSTSDPNNTFLNADTYEYYVEDGS